MIGDPISVSDLYDQDKELTETEKISIITENLEKLVYSLGDDLKDKLAKKE